VDEARLNHAENACLTKKRGRPRKADRLDIRISFRVDWTTYKQLVEKAGGKRRLSSFIRRKLGIE